jgi:hypothetical protein
MYGLIISIAMAFFIGCSDKGVDSAADEMIEDDTGLVVEDIPTGPIPGPEGTDTTPEEDDFDWSDVGSAQIGNTFPDQNTDWTDYPQYGTASLLPWSDSEECVCFDMDCSTCSNDDCSAETCTYDLNDNHTLTKYHVELQSITNQDHTISFEVNLSAIPSIEYTDIEDVLNHLERIPVEYWYGFKIITEFGHGIQFLHSSYFSGASAYGSMNYIDTQTEYLPTLIHELGHTFEQYTRIGNPPILEPQSNILNPIWRNAIRSDNNRTSGYGNNNEWEDLAEFARIYALSMIEGSLSQLEMASPERYRIWKRILLNGTTISQ